MTREVREGWMQHIYCLFNAFMRHSISLQIRHVLVSIYLLKTCTTARQQWDAKQIDGASNVLCTKKELQVLHYQDTTKKLKQNSEASIKSRYMTEQ